MGEVETYFLVGSHLAASPGTISHNSHRQDSLAKRSETPLLNIELN